MPRHQKLDELEIDPINCFSGNFQHQRDIAVICYHARKPLFNYIFYRRADYLKSLLRRHSIYLLTIFYVVLAVVLLDMIEVLRARWTYMILQAL